jgi:hypothetical protein
MNRLIGFAFVFIFFGAVVGTARAAPVKPGDLITPDNASLVSDLVSPGNLFLIKQGMRMNIVPTERVEWPPPYREATEKYSPQVSLAADGTLKNYLAGQPFPLLDGNDPEIARKVIWNFSFRPGFTDDFDLRDVEVDSYPAGSTSAEPAERIIIGHFAYYSNIGRTEIPPIPTDPDFAASDEIRYRFAAYPFLEPSEMRGYGFVRLRYWNPDMADNVWDYSARGRHKHRIKDSILSDSAARQTTDTYGSTIDPDSYFGFAAKPEAFDYKFLGIRPMLACIHAANSPAKPCPFDGHRTVCPENWEMRNLYVIEATPKPFTHFQRIGSDPPVISKRVLYIDSEAWLITASDQYNRKGELWKTLAIFNAYRDRPVPDARIAIYPFRRTFQTAMADEDLQDGFSTVAYTPGPNADEHECWYINMGNVTRQFFDPDTMARMSH